MAWLVLINHQTQVDKKMLSLMTNAASAVTRSPSRVAGGVYLMAEQVLASRGSYLAASFCSAIWPEAPSLSASLTLAQTVRA
jgi:hypothetical protein